MTDVDITSAGPSCVCQSGKSVKKLTKDDYVSVQKTSLVNMPLLKHLIVTNDS